MVSLRWNRCPVCRGIRSRWLTDWPNYSENEVACMPTKHRCQLDPGSGKTRHAYIWAYRSNALDDGPSMVTTRLAVPVRMRAPSSKTGAGISWCTLYRLQGTVFGRPHRARLPGPHSTQVLRRACRQRQPGRREGCDRRHKRTINCRKPRVKAEFTATVTAPTLILHRFLGQ